MIIYVLMSASAYLWIQDDEISCRVEYHRSTEILWNYLTKERKKERKKEV